MDIYSLRAESVAAPTAYMSPDYGLQSESRRGQASFRKLCFVKNLRATA